MICLSATPPSITPADLGVTASTYATFAEIMTGFSFAALAIYLGFDSARNGKRGSEHQRRSRYGVMNGPHERPLVVSRGHPIRRYEVVAVLFYSMGSLTISTFLYASLTAHIEDLGTAAGLLLLDGVTFGISALSF